MLSVFAGKRVLLLQGPMGLFFARLRKDLIAAGAKVYKVNFCPGDWLFYPRDAFNYRGTLDDWPNYLSFLLNKYDIEVVLLFGDCRGYHRVVPQVIRWRRTQLYVFEEGYLRPDFITIEPDGANNFSLLPRDPDFYRNYVPHPIAKHQIHSTKGSFSRAAFYAISYSLANFLFKSLFPNYKHHRSLNPFRESFYWLQSGARKVWYQYQQRLIGAQLFNQLSKNFFLVPLQTHNDPQIHVHSDFNSIEEFIERVMCSFAYKAHTEHLLVLKHHPLDRGYKNYHLFIHKMILKYKLTGRVFYIHDIHLPSLLDHALGTIVINSTVGLSSILHSTPVCVLGNPIYHLPGLTYQGCLDEFWQEPGFVDKELFLRFRAWLIAHNQANGNFYRCLANFNNHTGVGWPLFLRPEVSSKFLPFIERVPQQLQSSNADGFVKCAY